MGGVYFDVDMERFSFIPDDVFRKSLESDYEELLRAVEHGMYKSAQVIAGSIVEALLVSTLGEKSYAPKNKNHTVLDIALNEAIEASKNLKIISGDAENLASVIKSYRNLIHPGREIRTGEKPSKNKADISKCLVDMLIEEIEQVYSVEKGFTPQGIINKIISDPNAFKIIGELENHLSENVKFQLLKDEISRSINAALLNDSPVDNLMDFYNYIHRRAGEPSINRLSAHLENLIKHGTGTEISSYFNILFNAENVGRYSEQSRRLIFTYAISEFRNNPVAMSSKFRHFSDYAEEELIEALSNEFVVLVMNNLIDKSETNRFYIHNLTGKENKLRKAVLKSAIESRASFLDFLGDAKDPEIANLNFLIDRLDDSLPW